MRNPNEGSWHDQYKDSAYIHISGLPYALTEGDIITVFSQYGEPIDINLIKDRETGKSKGHAFLGYDDQRSTILAVDNLNGIQILGRTIKVDHVLNYKRRNLDEKKDLNEYAESELYNAIPKSTMDDVQGMPKFPRSILYVCRSI